MAAGVQTFDASGQTIFDMSSRIGLIIGTYTIGIHDGYFVDNRLGNGQPFWMLTTDGVSSGLYQPKIRHVYINGEHRIAWTWLNSGWQFNNTCYLTYGFY